GSSMENDTPLCKRTITRRNKLMSENLYVLGRVMMPWVFIISAVGKFMDVAGVAGNAGMARFESMIGGSVPPTVVGYIVASIEIRRTNRRTTTTRSGVCDPQSAD